MSKPAPVVYLLHGEDEYAIAQFVAGLELRMGDPALGAMNTTRLDGRTCNLDELLSVASAMPFLAKRRMVILTYPTARINNQSTRDNFLNQLKKIPPTTALVLIEYRLLTEEKDRKKGKLNWLEEYAESEKERIYLQAFQLPKGRQMVDRILKMAREAGGQFTPQAAALLGDLVGEDPRLANQEIKKLLVYVNFRRPVEPDDVELLTADYGQGDIFAMVDALGAQDGRKALGILHRRLEQQDPISIFGMVVRQFRLLLLTREVLDQEGQAKDVARVVNLHPYVVEKLYTQVRRFPLSLLEKVYHRLLEIDEAMKTSEVAGDLALEMFFAAFTDQPK